MGTEKFDFRTYIRFNERLGRTGTHEPVTTTENFLQRFSGLGFLRETIENPADLTQIVTGEKPTNGFSREEQLVANMN